MPRLGPAERAAIGRAVLAAAEVVDASAVQRWLASFAELHRRYLDAQRAVESAEERVATARARFNDYDCEQASRIAALARVLIGAGEPRANPFRGYGVPPPAAMERLALGDEVRALDRLIAAVRRAHAASRAVLEQADAADATARATEAALAGLATVQAAARAERVARDVIGRQWDRALAALNRAAHAATDDGAPHLHAVLFQAVRRRPARRVRPRRR